MNKRARKKQLTRARAPMVSPPGGSFIYVPAGQMQSIAGQAFYGSQMKNVPVGNTPLFSPGDPLPAQPLVDPLGKPIQFRYMPAYNSFPVDRSLGRPDIPSFEQLRRLAKMYSGITLNERYWLDLVPRMSLDIRLKKAYVDQGAETKDFQKEITYFKNFWEKPDGRQDIHTWLRKALREQTQVDELYLYKNRTRGRQLLGLWIVAGDQMKPLLDDWGMLPEAPDYAYQQYPWGIPGMMYSTDQMVHYQESPAADTPYGFSRVERVILEVNQALRKKKKDLANFTEGNIPQSFMEVPESLNWTPDQIDSYEQSWNALVAGQAQQQIRMKFLQPGMKYIPAEQYQMLTDFDLFLLKTTCGVYGVPITEFSFTEDSNRSSGESQEDMVYRRTIGPNAMTYGHILTVSMAEDFPPEYHGEMFEAVFTGFEEVEDEEKKAGAITTYTGAGILGLTDAAKMANLPIDPDAPPIGRMMMTQSGPVWLDDVATPEMRKAQQQATMAGYQLASNPPAPDEKQPGSAKEPPATGQKADKEPPEDDEPDEKKTLSRVVEVLERAEEAMRLMRARDVTPMVSQQGTCDCEICTSNHGRAVDSAPPYHDGCDCTMVPKGEEQHVTRAQSRAEDETKCTPEPGRADEPVARANTQLEDLRDAESGTARAKAISQEYRRWRERAVSDAKARRHQRPFVSALIPDEEYAVIWDALRTSLVPSVEDVRAIFERAKERDASPKVTASANGGSPAPSKSTWNLRW